MYLWNVQVFIFLYLVHFRTLFAFFLSLQLLQSVEAVLALGPVGIDYRFDRLMGLSGEFSVVYFKVYKWNRSIGRSFWVKRIILIFYFTLVDVCLILSKLRSFISYWTTSSYRWILCNFLIFILDNSLYIIMLFKPFWFALYQWLYYILILLISNFLISTSQLLTCIVITLIQNNHLDTMSDSKLKLFYFYSLSSFNWLNS